MDPLSEIRKLYFDATPQTIQRDLARAITLLKEMASEEERERAAVFMEGLAQMRGEWAGGGRRGGSRGGGTTPSRRKPPTPS